MRLFLLAAILIGFSASANDMACRLKLQGILPQISSPEHSRMREYLKSFIDQQVAEMPLAQRRRIMGVLNRDLYMMSDEFAYASNFSAALVSRVELTRGLRTQLIFFQKYAEHPYFGLSFAHEFAHLEDMVRGNAHVDALRYLSEEYINKDTVKQREEVAAKAEYKYLRGLYSGEDLQAMKKNYDHQKYVELRKKILPMRREMRRDPFAISSFSSQDLELYSEWVKLNLDRKLLKSLENAYSMSEAEYVDNWSTLYPYRVWNNQHNRRIDRNRTIAAAAGVLGTVGAVIFANSVFDSDEEDEKE